MLRFTAALLLLLTLGTTPRQSEERRPSGPRMSDEEFFQALDHEFPGLEKVKTALHEGDRGNALHAFAEHVRLRTKPVWRIDWRKKPSPSERPAHPNVEEADRAANNDLLSVDYRHAFGADIDWTKDNHPTHYVEWVWQLNRHQFWQTLGRAYWEAGDEKYAKAFVFQLTDWIKDNPVPVEGVKNGVGSAWRTLDAGLRVERIWLDALNYFLESPAMTDEAIVMMTKSFVEHARYLMKYTTMGNWLATEADGLYQVGVMFPEFREAEFWRKTGMERLYKELDNQVYPDGAQMELTTGYHQVSIDKFVNALRSARANERDLPADYLSKIEKMYRYDLYAVMPDGTLPGLNDAAVVNVRGTLAEGYQFFPDHKDFLWVATKGKEGEPPKEMSYVFPYAGQIIMRSGWDENARYLLMDAGPFGLGHQHEDKLNFVIFAYGKYLLAEAGIYAYDDSKWRRYVLSSYGHNVIHVDGKDQHRRGEWSKYHDCYVVRKPLPYTWKSTGEYDYASASFGTLTDEGFGPNRDKSVVHTRHILFVKGGSRGDYWLVADALTPDDDKEHVYESMFHPDTENLDVENASKRVMTKNPGAANLAIVPAEDPALSLEIVKGKEEAPVQGWLPDGLYKVRPIPVPIYKKKGKGATWFIYLFYPLAKDGAMPVKSVATLSTGDDGARVRVEFADGGKEEIAIGPNVEIKR